jgi:hypothetical protein
MSGDAARKSAYATRDPLLAIAAKMLSLYCLRKGD